MAEKKLRTELFVANKTFLVEGNLWVRAGDTIVVGHPLLKGRGDYFRPFAPTFTLPEPEPAPPAPADDGAAQ